MATELDKLVDPAPAPGSPAAFIIDSRRLSPHLQLAIHNRVVLAIDESKHGARDDQDNVIAKRAVTDILDMLAGYIDNREISMISALNSAAFHIGKVQRSITERRK